MKEDNLITNNIFITIDCDWASSEMIIDTAQIFLSNNIKATWFITDNNKGVDFLKKHEENFELGIHPNLNENSTQGSNFDEIFGNLFNISPDSKLVRTHGLLQSSKLLHIFSKKYRLKIDSSLFLPFCKNLQPHFFEFSGDNKLFRIPYNWGDNYILNNFKENKSNFQILNYEGLKVFNFHPIHIYHNTSSIEEYMQIKSGNYAHKSKSFGIKNYLLELIFKSKELNIGSQKLSKLYDEYEN